MVGECNSGDPVAVTEDEPGKPLTPHRDCLEDRGSQVMAVAQVQAGQKGVGLNDWAKDVVC